jgi:hypothetical protein
MDVAPQQREAMAVRMTGKFDQIGGYGVVACALLVFSIFAFLIELQSPDRVLWTGTKIAGSERGGIVFYPLHGRQESLDGTNFDNRARVTVYVYPSNPDSAMTGSIPDRIVDVAATVVPFGLAFVLLGVGVKRRPRRRLDDRLQRVIDKRAGASPPSSLR